MDGFKIDLSVLAGRIRGAPPAPAPVDQVPPPAGETTERRLPTPGNALANPLVTRKLRKCTISCRAEVVGIADGFRIALENSNGYDLALLRLRLERPDGEAECCVRQFVPYAVRRAVVPGDSSVMALAHETDPAIAIVDWELTAERIGVRLGWVDWADQYEWPDRDDWPAVGAIEVRDPHGLGRHRRRLDKQRREWTPAQARLVAGSSRGSYSDDREVWKLELDVDEPGGPPRRVALKARVPSLAVVRLFASKESGTRFGGLVTTMTTVARVGAPLCVLVSPKGEVAIDWEATLAQPALRAPDAL